MKNKFKIEAVNPVFTFWKDNRTDQEFKILATELRTKFLEWIVNKEKEWVEYYGSEQVILAFLTSKDGLSSTFDQSDFPEIYKVLRPEFKIHLQNSGQLNTCLCGTNGKDENQCPKHGKKNLNVS